LRAWREANPTADGAGTTVQEAFKLADRIFGRLLEWGQVSHSNMGPAG
jgi:hypothetical protein